MASERCGRGGSSAGQVEGAVGSPLPRLKTSGSSFSTKNSSPVLSRWEGTSFVRTQDL